MKLLLHPRRLGLPSTLPTGLFSASLLLASGLLVSCGADRGGEGSSIAFSSRDGGEQLDGATADVGGGKDSGGPGDTGELRGAGGDATRGECPRDACRIGGKCYDNGEPNPDNACEVCSALVAGDKWTADDDAECDDGEICTDKDGCTDGKCAGEAMGCGDDNACTADACQADPADSGKPACTHEPTDGGPCSDGDVCTTGDRCSAGTCKASGERVCDDGNVCTIDSCADPSGCKAEPGSGAACDDGELCTTGDACASGVCRAGGQKDCDDGNKCTLDGCQLGQGCRHKAIGALCKDDSVCTSDSCDPDKGCVYAFTTAKCDDSNLCTEQDTCALGLCVGATVLVDDGNPCTNDACDPATGVTHTNNTLPCDDGDQCTTSDACGSGSCHAGPELSCDDANVCTDDGCNAKAGCIAEPNHEQCDDADACTAGDVCAGGKCAGKELNCDDGNACTADSCDAKTGCAHQLVVSNKCRPKIVVSYPPRGATIKQSAPTVTVKGRITSGAGPITAATLNGKPLKLGAGGSFSAPVHSAVGGNTLIFHATDKLGSKRKRVQAYLWSRKYFKPIKSKPKSGMVAPGMAFFMDKHTIDDGQHTLPPNDLATIFELYFKSMDLGALIKGGKKPGEPDLVYKVIGIKYRLYIKKVSYGSPRVSLQPVTGALKMVATIPKLHVDFDLKRKKLLSHGDVVYPGVMEASSVVIRATVIPKVSGGRVVSEVKGVSVALHGFTIKITKGSLGGWILNGILKLFGGTVQKKLEAEFSKSIKNQIGPAVASALSALAITSDFEVGRLDDPTKKIKVTLVTDMWGTEIRPDGARFDLRAGAYADRHNTVDNLGVPGRIHCGSGVQKLVMERKNRLELGLADDTLNEILYAAWRGGLLEFKVPASMLGKVDPASYGVKKLKMKAKAWLAPTISDCNTAGKPKAHVGDFRIDAEMELLGHKLNVVLWATFVAGVDIRVDNKKGEISVALTKIEQIETEINVQQDKLIASEAAIDKMIGESLVKGLMGTLGGTALGSFPLPAVDLSKTMPGLPKGTAIAIDAKKVVRIGGNSIVEGRLK